MAKGLTEKQKNLPCHHIYDRDGSLLFDQICNLPEYYPTQAERSILEEKAEAISDRFPKETALVELGSGSSKKTQVLIDGFLNKNHQVHYWPIDISKAILVESSHRLLQRFPRLEITGLVGDYAHGLEYLEESAVNPKLILWLGSSIGNYSTAEAIGFLKMVHGTLGQQDRLLLGADLKKDPKVLERAYDDSQGITAQFNTNILLRINRELGGNFDTEKFSYKAVYSEAAGRVEMYQVSLAKQTVTIDNLDLTIHFEPGETIHTENSHKFSFEDLEKMAGESGFQIEAHWTDEEKRFSSNLLRPI